MNDFKNDFGNAMKQLSAGRDIVSSAKIRAAAERPERKISAKRIFGTAVAVCAFLICGITVAAAAGLIDFEAVFGNRITVEDTELANSLVGMVSDFKYKVSDNDYKIEIKGVTGDDNRALAIAEISRVDGEPVTDHFANPTDENQLIPLWERAELLDNVRSSGYGITHRVNKAGNIELYIDFDSEGGIDGKKITYKGKNFYPAGAYDSFRTEKNITYLRPEPQAGDIYTGYAQYDENGEIKGDSITPADVDDSGIIALDIEYEFSFTYTASDKSREVKSLDAPEESFPFILDVHKLKTTENFALDLTAYPSCIEVGSTGGRIDFEYENTGYEDDLNYNVNHYDNNEIYIILKSGERICCKFSSGIGYSDGGIYKCSYRIYYWDEDSYTSVFTDIDDITAISINGTVYELQ